MNRDAIPNEEAEKYFFHFPDGNASIARLLVRKLIPEAIPGNSVTDVVLARAKYADLDQDSSAVRIRLNSTAVRVRHQGDPANSREWRLLTRARKRTRYGAPHDRARTGPKLNRCRASAALRVESSTMAHRQSAVSSLAGGQRGPELCDMR